MSLGLQAAVEECPRNAPLGQPLPLDPHAISVSLPRWADNVGYEEGEERVISAMQAGYPRFFLHPLVLKLFALAEQRFAREGEFAMALPSAKVAERARQFIKRKTSFAARVISTDWEAVHVLLAPKPTWPTAKAFWQHTGEIVSSRWAESLLTGRERPPSAITSMNAVRERWAKLIGAMADDVYLYPSGMAAIAAGQRALQTIFLGRPSVQFGFPYVDSLKLQEHFGSGVHFLPTGDAADLETLRHAAKTHAVQGLFCEAPGNPLLATPDMERLGEIARGRFPLLVDDTLAACINLDVLPHADAVTTSLTKFFSGQGNVMCGALTLRADGPFYDRLKAAVESDYENLIFPDDVRAIEVHSIDVESRVRRINASAEILCDELARHPFVDRICYPKMSTPENYQRLLRREGGYGGLFSLILKDGPTLAPRFFDSLPLAKGPNLGTNFTLCCPYTLLAHYNELDEVERHGISRYLIRVSVGLEDPSRLRDCFLETLDFAARER